MLFFASQAFSAFALISIFITFQWKKKSTLLVWQALTNAFLAASYALLFDWIGTALLTTATVRCICFAFMREKENVQKTLSVSLLLFFLAIHCISIALLWEGWFDFILLIGIILLTIGLWQKGNNFVRLATMIYAALMIIHNVNVDNWAAVAVDLVTIAANAVYYFRLVRRCRKLTPSADSILINNLTS